MLQLRRNGVHINATPRCSFAQAQLTATAEIKFVRMKNTRGAGYVASNAAEGLLQ